MDVDLGGIDFTVKGFGENVVEDWLESVAKILKANYLHELVSALQQAYILISEDLGAKRSAFMPHKMQRLKKSIKLEWMRMGTLVDMELARKSVALSVALEISRSGNTK